MGAGCSSSAITKYKVLRNYLTSKPCLTFDFVQAFIPVRNGPPIILFGENHDTSEANSMVQRCVTAFTAMKLMVSDCNKPTCRIHFIMEGHPGLMEHTPDVARDVFDIEAHLPSSPALPTMNMSSNKFSLHDVAIRSKKYGKMYADGLSLVHFDMFYFLRLLYDLRDDSAARQPMMNYEFLVRNTKRWIEEALSHMGANVSNLPDMYEIVDRETNVDTERYRPTVQPFLNKLSADAEGLYHPFWMFRVACWVYRFTMEILYDADAAGFVWRKDLEMARKKLIGAMVDISLEPRRFSMFAMITLCGDCITYCVYLRKRLLEKTLDDDIFVLYGGSVHMLNISELIAATNAYKEDFVKLSALVCKDPIPPFYKGLCSKHANG